MLIRKLLRLFFHWLYHQLAFAYDLVAAAVSLGHWNNWGHAILPFITGGRVLELGHGPGYLQRTLKSRPLWAVGLDESFQMSRIAARRLRKTGISLLDLVRAHAQSLPFRAGGFDTLVSTFPSDYIFDPLTLGEVRRVLAPGGRLVVLPVAWPSNPALAWLFKITGESPADALLMVNERLARPFSNAGFHVDLKHIEVKSGRLVVIIASLPG